VYISGPVTGRKFVDREVTLRELKQHAEARQYCCLIGLRRTGKTSLMINMMDLLPSDWLVSYFNVQTSIAVPEQFATTYVGSILFWVLQRQGLVERSAFPQFFDLGYAQRRVLALKNDDITAYLIEMGNILAHRNINYAQVLQLAFAFPEVLSQALGRPMAVFLDEFQDIVQMDAYNVETLNLFRSTTQMQSGLWYCLAGSSISQLNTLVNAQDSPLFGQYKTFLISGFDFAATKELIELQVEQPVPESVSQLLYDFTSGHPFYLTILAGAAAAAAEGEGSPLAEEHVLTAIINEVCAPTGAIAMHCRQVFETMLRMATQSTVSRQIMYYLAHHQPATAPDVGRYVGRSPDFIRQILARMVETDLLQVHRYRYSITDPVLAFWLARSYFDIEINPLTQIDFESTRARLFEDLRETLLSSRESKGKKKETRATA
jgi:hypothetical protein